MRLKIIFFNPKSSRHILQNVIIHRNIAYFDRNKLMKIDLKTGYNPVPVERSTQGGSTSTGLYPLLIPISPSTKRPKNTSPRHFEPKTLSLLRTLSPSRYFFGTLQSSTYIVDFAKKPSIYCGLTSITYMLWIKVYNTRGL